MDGRLTVGVLSTFLGGPYYGGLLTGIQRAASAAGGRVIAIQTLDGGSEQIDLPEPPDFRLPVAWDLVSGFVLLVSPVDTAYVKALRRAGKPVVVVSHRYPGVGASVIGPDNRGGVRQAVSHLIRHGHRRIAFAGYRTAYDVRLRYEAYRDTLVERGIRHDPDLVFEADSNKDTGGRAAATAMLAAAERRGGALPSTAVVCGTDATALGLMRTLSAAGYKLPDDQAVVGFDDVAAAEFSTPSLATVRQPLHDIGATAVDVLARQLGPNAVPIGPLHVPTIFTPRESCGCAGRFARPARDRARLHFTQSTYLQKTLSTQYEVSVDLLRSHQQSPHTMGWLQRTRARAGCLGLWGNRAEAGDIRLTGVFVRDSTRLPSRSARPARVDAFPPPEVLDAAESEPVFVVPVSFDTRDWGLLAIVNEIEHRVPTGRELVNQWAALLAVALDHETMLHSLREQEDQLRRAARYDELTGLPNRAFFVDRLRLALARARGRRRPQPSFAVLFIDLDGFKVVNDSLGHSAGDLLLAQVAQRISVGLRDVDTAARFGGDEFLVLLDDIDDPDLPARVARRLHHVLARPFHLDGQEVVVTGSIGIALGSERYDNADDVLRDADLAMYWAKSHGKGTHAVFDVAMHATAMSRLRVEAELRQALDRAELEVHYQPIVDLRGGHTAAFEALVRWRHPSRGLLPPRDFMAVAEESGLTLPLGRMVLADACHQLAAWRAGAPDRSDLRVSVNVSNRQFWHGNLLDDVDELLDSAGLDPPNLALEITEGVVMHQVDQARKTLGALQDRGVQVHIDDFGTGYSSLEALHHLPIDALKIDRSFVSRLGVDGRSAELVRTIVLMAGNLGLDVIAEGVESTDHHDRLRELGTAFAQGYLFSGPLAGGRAGGVIRLPWDAPRHGPAR